MPKLLMKFLMVLGGLFGGVFVLFLARDFFFSPIVQGEFFLPYWLIHSVVDVLDAFLPLFLTALVVAFSYFIKIDDLPKLRDGSLSPSKTVLGAFVPVAAGIFVNSLIVLSLLPGLRAQLAHWDFLTGSLRQLESQLSRDRDKVFQAWDYLRHYPSEGPQKGAFQIPMGVPPDEIDKRIQALGRLLAIRGDDKTYADEYYKAVAMKQEQTFLRQYAVSHPLERPKEWENFTLDRLLDQGRELEKSNEPVRGNLAAQFVLKDLVTMRNGAPSDRVEYEKRKTYFDGLDHEARELYQKTWEQAQKMRPSLSDRARASYFQREGKSLEDFKLKNYLEAYYGFLELSKENPLDREAQKYLELSRAEVSKTVIFREDVEQYMALGGYTNLFFFNPLPDQDDRRRELVRVGTMVETKQGTFLKDIEVFDFDAQTGLPLPYGHFKAPYGRIQNHDDKSRLVVDLETRERDRPSSDYLPEYVRSQNENPLATKFGFRSKDMMSLTIGTSLGDLELSSDVERRYNVLDLSALFSEVLTLQALGYSTLPQETEFVSRILNALELFVLSFWALYVAWTLRSRMTRGRLFPAILLLGLLPLVIWYLIGMFHWAAKLSAATLILTLGLWVALILLAVLVLPLTILAIYLFWRKLAD